jgi:hypothetical protein
VLFIDRIWRKPLYDKRVLFLFLGFFLCRAQGGKLCWRYICGDSFGFTFSLFPPQVLLQNNTSAILAKRPSFVEEVTAQWGIWSHRPYLFMSIRYQVTHFTTTYLVLRREHTPSFFLFYHPHPYRNHNPSNFHFSSVLIDVRLIALTSIGGFFCM